jgi:hypothetical protein
MLLLGFAPSAYAQANAANGSVEGTVSDPSGAVLPGVNVTVLNVDSGARRTVVTNDRGLYRAPLLPLGSYTISAELDGFKKYERGGIPLSAGQSAVVDITLSVGELSEVLTITTDAPLIDAGNIDVGRNINEREVKNLPLISRNPYNFALLQPGVTGREQAGFGVPRFAANGMNGRIDYQIDGNSNTQKDRAGLRLLPMSEVMIGEVKVITSGFAPEFGRTTGVVYNAITPSGTNTVRGSGSYRFQRKGFSAYPFYYVGERDSANRPDSHVDNFTAEVGGPIIKNKLHYFGGWEQLQKTLITPITTNPDDIARLGLPAQPGIVPGRDQVANFYIMKGDYQLSDSHRLTARHIGFRNREPGMGAGTLATLDRLQNFTDIMSSTAAQAISNFGGNKLNEIRVQYATRHTERPAHPDGSTAVGVNIAGVANFGGPGIGADFVQSFWQVAENFTWITGAHSFKFGGDAQFVHDDRTSALTQTYTFPSVQAYLDAKSGVNPRGYTTFAQTIGEPFFDMDTKIYSAFVQDDWRLSPSFKLLYGVRYDIYTPTEAVASAPYEFSRSFKTDKNNISPRFGMAWTLDESERTILRASTGLMYDQPLLAMYEQAVSLTGSPRLTSVSLGPASAGAPAYPNTLADIPAGFALPPQAISVVDPNFEIGRTFQNNVQIERAFGHNYTTSIGVIYAKGDNLPVLTDVNLINPVRFLSDGRPVFNTAVNATTRLDPRFNRINTFQSIADSTYTALTLGLNKRWANNYQFNLSYTSGKGEDNAPLSTLLAINGEANGSRSDPTNLERDRGPNILNIKHNLVGSIVGKTNFGSGGGVMKKIFNDNQIGIMLQFNSGMPFNITSNLDLNQDGIGADRPIGIDRNSLYNQARYNVDMRYSRFIPISGAFRFEVLAEFKNLFNILQTETVNSVVTVDTSGLPITTIPDNWDGFRATGGFDQRQLQIGVKVYFE